MSMIPAPNAAPITGAAWLTDWEMPFEGGFTLLSKFAWANSLDAAQLCSTVFAKKLLKAENVGPHGRSLLDLGWTAGDSLGIPYLRDKVVEGALARRAGRWTRVIAADAAFRFCPHCLAHGYQSALYQLEGLLACPIHSEPLISGCRQCGHPSVRYAVTEAGFSTPFHCPACLAPLAGTFSPAAWSDLEIRHAALTRLAPIAQWLMQLSSSTLKWDGWDDWHFPLRWHCTDAMRRVASLNVLLQALPPPPEVQVLRRRREAPQVYRGGIHKQPHYFLLWKSAVEVAGDAGRVAIYKAVRRHVCRRLRGCARLVISHLPDELLLERGSGAMKLSVKECPRLQAFLLWRFHFEAAQYDRHRLVLRPAMLQWPGGAVLDTSAWAAFCLASFYAAAEGFNEWRSQATLLKDADLLGADRENARALHAKFAPLLAPSIMATFPAVTSLTYIDRHDVDRILIVGPADAAVSTPVRHDRGLWCACRSGRGRNCQGTVAAPSAPALPTCGPATARAYRGTAQQVNLAYFVPMEQLQLPPALDGTLDKAERDKRQCVLDAEDDLEAISLWLDGCARPATRKAYARQIEKVLIWCVAQRGIALSRMTVDDVDAFMTFLADPTPRDVWLPKHTSGAARRWSPFRTAPARNTQDMTFEVLSMLFTHWANHRFILNNPWRRSRRGRQTVEERDAEVPPATLRDAVITQAEWCLIVDTVGPPLENVARSLVLGLAYYAAMKPTEIGAIRLRHLRRVPARQPGADIWSVDIPTRNALRREVFLVPQVTTLLQRVVPPSKQEFDMMVQGNPDVLLMDILDPAPAPRRSDLAIPLAGAVLSDWLKPLFRQAGHRASRAGDTVAAERLARASLSWFSHALETHLKMNGNNRYDCWVTIGAYKFWPISLEFLPQRCGLTPAGIEDAMAGLLQALERLADA